MLIRIESAGNARLRLIRKLSTRKGRSEEGRFVIEGINLVREALTRRISVDFIMIPESMAVRVNEDVSRTDPVLRRCIESTDITVCCVPDRIFSDITDAEHGIGVIAVISMPVDDVSPLYRLPKETNILVLERIQDPGNIGTMIRTAAAAGYGMILALKGTADILSPKVLRSTAGMVFDIPFAYVDSVTELTGILRDTGRRIAVTDPAGGIPYYQENLRRETALVIGNEGNGICDELMAEADVRVNIPMKGNVESLNAAVSAAILMYEAVRNN